MADDRRQLLVLERGVLPECGWSGWLAGRPLLLLLVTVVVG